MASRRSSSNSGGDRPRPVGWSRAVNPTISRRQFIAGAATTPLLVESALARDDPPEMALEFDLSKDRSTLNIRMFVAAAATNAASRAKSRRNVETDAGGVRPLAEATASHWITLAASYGPAAWFDLTTQADDFTRSVVVRNAQFGETGGKIKFEFRFEATTITVEAPATAGAKGKPGDKRTYAVDWKVTLVTDLFASDAPHGGDWRSATRAFRDFANASGESFPLDGPVAAAPASDRLAEMFDDRASSDAATKTPLRATFRRDGAWTLQRENGVAAACFNARARASRFTFGWFRDKNCAPYFYGFAGAGDGVKIDRRFQLGRGEEVRVLVDCDEAAARWELRRSEYPFASAEESGVRSRLFETYSKISFGAATLTVLRGEAAVATPLAAETLFVTECDLPLKGAPLRHVLWGDPKRAQPCGPYFDVSTVAGHLVVDAPAQNKPQPPNSAQPSAAPDAACAVADGASPVSANADAALAVGDRSGAPDAAIWAVFDWVRTVGDYSTRRLAVDLALHRCDLALPDVSRSALVFDNGPAGEVCDAKAPDLDPGYADLRLLYDDGRKLLELPFGEYPRREASSFVWLGALERRQTLARFDLSRATLAASRDLDLVNLRFRFLDLTLTLEVGQPPVVTPRHGDCRVVQTAPGEYRDDRPVLVVEFDPQHLFEEAIFGQFLELPDVPLDNPTRSDILNKIAGYHGDVPEIAKYKCDIQKLKRDQDKSGEFTQFACRYAMDARVGGLPADQRVYIGPFALDPDAMGHARRIEREIAIQTVAKSVEATFNRLKDFIAADQKRPEPARVLARVVARSDDPKLPASYWIEAALRNEALLEQQEPLYAAFRDFYREQMAKAFATKPLRSLFPIPYTLDSIDSEFFFVWPSDPTATLKNLPDWPDNYSSPPTAAKPYWPPSARFERLSALLGGASSSTGDATFVGKIAAADPPHFTELTEARLSGRSRLAFRINCAPPVQANALEAGLTRFSEDSPDDPGAGGFAYPPIPFSFTALTDWSRHELAVTRRAQKLFEANKDGLVPPIGFRAPNLSDPDNLVFQGISRGAASADQRLGEIRAALARKPGRYETAIEIPARLTLSPAQDAIWLTRRPLAGTDPEANAGDANEENAGSSDPAAGVMKPGDDDRTTRAALWTARLDIADADPGLRVIDSPDLRPNALTWLRAGGVRQIGQGAPPRGPLAPWFVGPEQMDGVTLTPSGVNKELTDGAKFPRPSDIDLPPPAGEDLSDEELCKAGPPSAPGWRNRIWTVLRRLCQRQDERPRDDDLRLFLATLDAYDRHELVLLSSAYGLPVIGKRKAKSNGQGKPETPGGLVDESGQIESGDDFLVLDADDAQAIQRPQPLRVQELWFSALGGSFVHDTRFYPSAGANDLFGGKIFDGFSIERWREEIVVGREIVGEVVYKGYMFPFGHRASLVKLTERLFLKGLRTLADGCEIGVKAVLVQRIFLRIGRKTMSYPAVGQPLGGRLWCAKEVTIRTVQTPDLQNPFSNPPLGDASPLPLPSQSCVATGDGPTPETISGGRINLGGHPGFAFWPRVNETDEGLVKFDMSIDAAQTQAPLIFVDNVAATSPDSLQTLIQTFRFYGPWKSARRTLRIRGQIIRFAEETKTGDCSFKTDQLVVSVNGRAQALGAGWIEKLEAFDTTSILEGAEQPPFYPALEAADIRLEQVERFSGGKPAPATVQYDGRYARFGFAKPQQGDQTRNQLEIYLDLLKCVEMKMGANGDRGGGVGRPETYIVALGRAGGPVGGDSKLAFYNSAPPTIDNPAKVDHIFSDENTAPLKDQSSLIPAPRACTTLPPLTSVADYFDPQNRRPPPPASGAPAPARPQSPSDEKRDRIREVLKSCFNPNAKILGVVTFQELLSVLGFDVRSLADAGPALKETLLFGSGLEEAGADLVEEIHAHLLAPLLDTLRSFQTQWEAAGAKVAQTGRLSLSQIYPEIGDGLADLERKLAAAQADSDIVGLALDLSDVYESARNFAAALQRLAANPTARLKQAAIGAIQDELAGLSGYATLLERGLSDFANAVQQALQPDALGRWLDEGIARFDPGGVLLGDAASLAIAAPTLGDVSKQVGATIAGYDKIVARFDADLVLGVVNQFENIASQIGSANSAKDITTKVGAAIASQVTRAFDDYRMALVDAHIDPSAPALYAVAYEALRLQNAFDKGEFGGDVLPVLRNIGKVAFELADNAKALIKAVKEADAPRALAALGVIAADLFGPSGVAAADAVKYLADGPRTWGTRASDALKNLAPQLNSTSLAAYADELKACGACWPDGPIAGRPTVVLVPPQTDSGPLTKALAAAVLALGKAKNIDDAVAAAAANAAWIDSAISPPTPGFTADFIAFMGAVKSQFLLGGTPGPGFADDLSQLYCMAAAAMAGLRAVGAEVSTGWGASGPGFADRIYRYLRAIAAHGGDLAKQTQALCEKAKALTTANDAFAPGAPLSASLQKIVDAIDAAASTPLQRAIFADARKDLQDAEDRAINALVVVINRCIAVATQAVLFDVSTASTVLGDIRGSAISQAIAAAPQMRPAFDDLTQALTKLLDRLQAAALLTPITANPTSLKALLAVVVMKKPNVDLTVAQVFGAASADSFASLASDLANAEAQIAAAWRDLQMRATGLPMVWLNPLLLAMKPLLGPLGAVYNDPNTGLLKLRNELADQIDTPMLTLQARRAVFVAPAYVSPAPVDVDNPSDDPSVLAQLKTQDRLSEEASLLAEIAAYPDPPYDAGLSLSKFIRFADSWEASDEGQWAAPLQIAAKVKALAAEVLKGEILSLIDISAFRDALLDAVAKLVPTKAKFSYNFEADVSDDGDGKSVFQADKGGRFTLTTSIEVDLIKNETQVIAKGALGPFTINLVSGIVDALKLNFAGAGFESRGGGAPRFDIAYRSYEVGADLSFVKDLEAYLTPSDGAGFHMGPSEFGVGIEVGYGVNLGGFSIGPVSFFNIIFDVTAVLPFDDSEALFRTSLGTRTSPFTISALPYAGSGYFAIYASASGIKGFEAGFMFGGGGSVTFGPLHAQVQVQVGAFIRIQKIKKDGQEYRSTEIGATFLAAGSANIWIFHFGASLYVALSQEDGGDMHGEAIFTFSFSCGIFDYNYSVTAHHKQAPVGHNNSSSGWLDAPGASPTLLAAVTLPGHLRDFDDDFLLAAVQPGAERPDRAATGAKKKAGAPARKIETAPACPTDRPPPDVTSTAVCQSENWKTYSSYFDPGLLQAQGAK